VTSELTKPNLVIYHGNCYDGVTAAYVAWLYLKETADYIPFNYSDPPPDVKGKNIYIVDFSFKRDVILALAKDNYVVVLDHHKTAEAELRGLEAENSGIDIEFDMNRSGAGIAWDYFFSVPRLPLVNYIEDRDLWRFKLPNSREVNAWIQSWDIDLDTWKSLLRQQSKLVKQICDNARLKELPQLPSGLQQIGIVGPYVETSILMSEVCEQLLLDSPMSDFSWYSFLRKDGKRQYGLRSRNTENFDVSAIAKQYGGGGHKNAAGFELAEGENFQNPARSS